MTPGESFISIILVIIAYFLSQIAKQLSYLTGKRLKSPFTNWQSNKPIIKPHPRPDPKEEKLPN